MNFRKLLIASMLVSIPVSVLAEWKVGVPWEGEIRMWEDGTPASVVISGYTGPGPNMTIPEKITVENWETVDGEYTVIETAVVPVLGVDDGHEYSFNCPNASEIESITFSDGILFVERFDGWENLRRIAFNGPVKFIRNSFNSYSLGNITLTLSGAELVENSFNWGDYFDLTTVNLHNIKKIVNSFDLAYVPEGVSYRLPEGLKVLKAKWGDFRGKNSTIICPESLDTLEYSISSTRKIVIPKDCVFSINVGGDCEVYYLGTKDEFMDHIIGGIHQNDEDSPYRWASSDNSIKSLNYVSRHKIFTDTRLSESGEATGELLTELTWPESVPVIPEFISTYRFLEKLTIPAIEKVGSYAFYKCCGLKEISVNAREIGYYAFAGDELYGDGTRVNLTTLDKVTIGSNVKKIEEHAFHRCIIGNFVADKSVSDWLNMERDLSSFWVIEALTVGGQKIEGELVLPSDVVTIPTNAFPGNKLTGIVIPASVNRVAQSAMSGSEELTSVKFEAPAGRSANGLVIERSAFWNCPKLSEIEFGRVPDVVGSGAFRESAWENGQPDGAIMIGDEMLYRHKGNAVSDDGSYRVPEGVRVVCENAFDNMRDDLLSLDLPSTLTTLYSQSNLSELKDIYARSRTPNEYDKSDYYGSYLLPWQFYGGEGTIHVYADAVDTYKATKGWNGMLLYGEFMSTNIEAYDFAAGVDVAKTEGNNFHIDGMTVYFTAAVSHAAVYDLAGCEVWSGNAADMQVTLPSKGVYMLNVDGNVSKVMVR